MKDRTISREVCMALCAIIHAAIDESSFFTQAAEGNRRKLQFPRKYCFSDGGVMIGMEDGKITAKVHIGMEVGSLSIHKTVLGLQKRIFHDAALLTGHVIGKVDVFVANIGKAPIKVES
ncbi:hypothetical protein [Bacillus sp. REN3]|uniref:hypothetical protein n=1 Tax=Bacillus sp. REN3 TaxID=2802440 RepID=UPI001AEEA5DA|nr:hypothetical protein [Bacillus sp. REN3]